jgi:adenosylcobinamide kinase/adenosylcobinamide-phosphate guanylyltransferase
LPLQNLALVLGGASSGKSAFAEGLVTGTGLSRVYLATAQAWDAEMAAKIARHRESRGPDWCTVEAPLDLVPGLAQRHADEAVLIDCATLWLTNQMLAEADLGGRGGALWTPSAPAPRRSSCVQRGGAGHRSRDPARAAVPGRAGRLNQRLAPAPTSWCFVAAGCPLVLKGTLP